jgi:hypothetical protein
MSWWRVTTTAIVALSAIVGIGAQVRSGEDADRQELEQYRLTTETLKKVEVAVVAAVNAMKNDPIVQMWQDANREAEALKKKDALTAAEARRLQQLQAIIESEPFDVDVKAETLTEMAAQLAKIPPLASALKDAGLTPREYAKFMFAMSLAGMAHGFQKAGGADQPLVPGVAAENVKFMVEHEAELERLGKLIEDAAR